MRIASIILVLLSVVQVAPAAERAAPDAADISAVAQTALEERLFADAADRRLDDFSPLEAALVAGGAADRDCLRRYRQKAAGLVERLRNGGVLDAPPRERVEAVLRFMHKRVLRGDYDLKHSDLRRVFDEGRYNCVTATVLFNYLGEQAGLNCRGLQMPGHAMSRVLLAEGPLDVETTCPRWFQLAGSPARRAAAAAETIGAAASTDRSKARLVSPIQLAAMIYYNRGVDLLAEKRFAEALAANRKALRLDPANAAARDNLLATINNWSIELGARGRYDEALKLLRRGMAMDDGFEAFAENFIHFHRKRIDLLCSRGRFAEALETLSPKTPELPDADYFARVENEIYERWSKAVAGDPRPEHSRQLPCIHCTAPVE